MRLAYLLILLSLLASSCKKKGEVIWEPTLEKESQQPYGTYLSHKAVSFMFPKAKLTDLPKQSRFSNMQRFYSKKGRSLLIFSGFGFSATAAEWESIEHFAMDGNIVMIFSNKLHDDISGRFDFYQKADSVSIYSKPNRRRQVVTLVTDTLRDFTYEGRSISSYYLRDDVVHFHHEDDSAYNAADSALSQGSNADSVQTAAAESMPDQDTAAAIDSPLLYELDTFGYVGAYANLLRFRVGDGAIYMHSAPLVLSNYFLLQPDNINYLTGLLGTFPADVENVFWYDFFQRNVRDERESVWDKLMKIPPIATATWIVLIGALLYVLFQSKRKQRRIPIVPPLKNESVSFVETVGQLYFNKRNNKNLAEKMIQQFLEWVRNTYYLSTNHLNAEFEIAFAGKSGADQATIKQAMNMIRLVRTNDIEVTDEVLLDLYNTLQTFYKKPI